MTTITEKKEQLEELLDSAPGTLIRKRKELIELCELAEYMRDSASIAKSVMNPDTGSILPEICENYRNDQAVLLGYTDYDDMIDAIDDGLEVEDDCSADGTASWTGSGSITLNFDSDHYTVTTSATDQYVTLPITSATFTAGTSYIISIDVKDGTEADAMIWLYFYFTSASGNHTLTSPSIVTTTDWTTYSFVFTPSVVSTSNEVVGLKVKNNITGNFQIKNFICREYYPDQLMKFDFRTTSEYGDDHDFTLPTTTGFGYLMHNPDGTLLNSGDISTTPADDHYYEKLYLVKDTSSDLVTRYDGYNLSVPSVKSVTTILDSDFKTETDSLTVVGDISEVPIFQSEGATIDIYLTWGVSDEAKIGEVDELSEFTQFGGYTYIDTNNSSIDYNAQTISIVFSETPSDDDVTVEIRYTYDNANYSSTQSDNHTTYDFSSDVFVGFMSGIGSQGPIYDTIEVYLNDEQIGMMNDDGEFYGSLINDSSYFNAPGNWGIGIKDITTSYENTVRVEYVEKNNLSKTDSIGTINVTSVTYSVSLDTPVCLNDIEVYLGTTKIVENGDFTTSWSTHTPSNALTTSITDAYDTGGATTKAYVTVCTCTQAGVFSITITKGTGDYIYPDTGGVLKVVYDVANDYSTWNSSYTEVPFSSVNNGGTINTCVIGVVSTVPTMLEKYTVKKYIDHTIYGHLTVMSEGLEVDPSWDFTVNTPDECTFMDSASFDAYLNWLTPYSTDDDLFKSCEEDEYSYSTESELYSNIERSPFLPELNDTYDDSVDLFNDTYVNVTYDIDGLSSPGYSYRINWAVLSKYKFEYKRAPAITLADTSLITHTITDRDEPIDLINDATYDLFDDLLSTLDTWMAANMTSVPDVPADGANVYTIEEVGGYWKILEDGGAYTHKFNDLTASSAYQAVKDQMDLLSTDGLADSDIEIFWDLINFKNWRDNFSTNRDFGDYNEASTDCKNLYDALTTFDTGSAVTSGSRLKAFTTIDSLIGTVTASGYSKDIYDAVTYAIEGNIRFVKNVIDKYNNIQGYYDYIQTYIDEWNIYDTI